jgi:hypothetical protein
MTAGGINTRLLLWLQLRCAAAALVVSAAGWLLFVVSARLLLPWWPLVLVVTAAAEGCFYVVWKRKHAEVRGELCHTRLAWARHSGMQAAAAAAAVEGTH